LRLVLSANSHHKRKIIAENRHQPTPIRISGNRLRSQNTWAEVLSLLIYLFTLNALKLDLYARGGGCGTTRLSI
jgi:hypothetical protein